MLNNSIIMVKVITSLKHLFYDLNKKMNLKFSL